MSFIALFIVELLFLVIGTIRVKLIVSNNMWVTSGLTTLSTLVISIGWMFIIEAQKTDPVLAVAVMGIGAGVGSLIGMLIVKRLK